MSVESGQAHCGPRAGSSSGGEERSNPFDMHGENSPPSKKARRGSPVLPVDADLDGVLHDQEEDDRQPSPPHPSTTCKPVIWRVPETRHTGSCWQIIDGFATPEECRALVADAKQGLADSLRQPLRRFEDPPLVADEDVVLAPAVALLVALGGWMRRGLTAVWELLGRSASARRAAAKVGRAVERDASILARDDVIWVLDSLKSGDNDQTTKTGTWTPRQTPDASRPRQRRARRCPSPGSTFSGTCSRYPHSRISKPAVRRVRSPRRRR